ncbi:hypothetical protein CTA1_8938 [Colletotrichum tanaceti]|uniref:Uncharacterized protein n=1 Tax=Colletotrichum tanaceti TaxID=1306861 RepID=A0A4U6X8S1_9PEZI|nr:hypothetical protein CTA1_8938 [Colletotrichum tanaceti]
MIQTTRSSPSTSPMANFLPSPCHSPSRTSPSLPNSKPRTCSRCFRVALSTYSSLSRLQLLFFSGPSSTSDGSFRSGMMLRSDVDSARSACSCDMLNAVVVELERRPVVRPLDLDLHQRSPRTGGLTTHDPAQLRQQRRVLGLLRVQHDVQPLARLQLPPERVHALPRGCVLVSDVELEAVVVGEAHPVAVAGLDAEDVPHHVELVLVKVLVDGRTQQSLELVDAVDDFELRRLLDVDRRTRGRLPLLQRLLEPECFRGRSREALFDAVERLVGHCVDIVDDAVEQRLRAMLGP